MTRARLIASFLLVAVILGTILQSLISWRYTTTTAATATTAATTTTTTTTAAAAAATAATTTRISNGPNHFVTIHVWCSNRYNETLQQYRT